MATKEELLAELSRCVLEMEDEEVTEVARAYAAEGYDPLDGILGGLVDGMDYGADVTITVSLPQGAFEVLQQRLTELSAGSVTLQPLGESLRPGPREEI